MGFFDKLKAGLAKTKQLLQTDIRDLLKAGEILDEPKLVEFEKRLLNCCPEEHLGFRRRSN